MSSILVIASLLVSAVPPPPASAVDAAYEDLQANRNETAIERIESSVDERSAHPAQLINLGVAYARQGDRARARAMFERAAASSERYELETADGQWVESRRLALKALAALDRGTFGTDLRTASR